MFIIPLVCSHPIVYIQDMFVFVSGGHPLFAPYVQVQKLVEMGFPEDLVRSTLKSVDGDENMALEKLCSG